jgi:hypothetical protein
MQSLGLIARTVREPEPSNEVFPVARPVPGLTSGLETNRPVTVEL